MSYRRMRIQQLLENTFAQLHRPIRAHLEKIGLEEPSDIQKIAIPSILRGENVLVIAPTGTGKTLASMLPIFNMFSSAVSRGDEGYLNSLRDPTQSAEPRHRAETRLIGKELGHQGASEARRHANQYKGHAGQIAT